MNSEILVAAAIILVTILVISAGGWVIDRILDHWRIP